MKKSFLRLCLSLLDNFVSFSCTVDGKYTEWSQWTECTVTCGGGTQTRNRSCTNPPPQNGGKSCLDQGLGPEIQTQNCNVQPCPSKLVGVMDSVKINYFLDFKLF